MAIQTENAISKTERSNALERTPEVKEQYQEIRHGDRLERVGSSSKIDSALENDVRSILAMNGVEVKGPLSDADVRQAQGMMGVGVDGIIGPETMRAFDANLRPGLPAQVAGANPVEYILNDKDHSHALLKTRGGASLSQMSMTDIRGMMENLREGKGDFSLGEVSSIFESGGRGPGVISSGRGDFGGVSYGTYQLSSARETLNKFLEASGYDKQFAGLKVGSEAFNQKWRSLAKNDTNFGAEQHRFIVASHYKPQMDMLASQGIDLKNRGPAVKEMVFSTASQYGPQSKTIARALASAPLDTMSDAKVIALVQQSKLENVRADFVSSPQLWGSLSNRIQSESRLLFAMSGGSKDPKKMA